MGQVKTERGNLRKCKSTYKTYRKQLYLKFTMQ